MAIWLVSLRVEGDLTDAQAETLVEDALAVALEGNPEADDISVDIHSVQAY